MKKYLLFSSPIYLILPPPENGTYILFVFIKKNQIF